MSTEPDLHAPVAWAEGVRLLRWPAEDATRAALERERAPRILLLAPGSPPPERWGDLEDWLRLPLDPDELRSRARTLRHRARAKRRPQFDDEGFLRAGERWIDLPPGPRAVAGMLIERFGELVHTLELTEVYLSHGGSGGDAARKAMIARLRKRLGELDLTLRSVRESGYVLDWADVERDVTQPSELQLIS